MVRSSYQPKSTAAPKEYLYDVFLSHHSSDKQLVETLAVRLEEAQLKPFLDKWHLVPGASWQEELEDALDSSATCAVFLGPLGVGTWQNEEMRAALDDRVRAADFRVIPVLLPRAEPSDLKTLPKFLRRLTWVDFRGGIDDAEALHRLVAGIKGVRPGRLLSPATSQKRKTFVVVLSGTIEEMDRRRVEAITEHLRLISEDFSLTIHEVQDGSVRLLIESSAEGYERLRWLYGHGRLIDVLGSYILRFEVGRDTIDHQTLTPEDENIYLDAVLAREQLLGVKFPKAVATLNHLAMDNHAVSGTAFEDVYDDLSGVTVLTNWIYRESVSAVLAGASLDALKRGINQAVGAVVQEIRSLARPIGNLDAIAQISAIAARGDATVGKVIATVMEKVGRDGVITVEPSPALKAGEVETKIVEGINFDRGYLSSNFVTDPERMEVVLQEPLVLIHEKQLYSTKNLLPFLEQTVMAGKSLLIIAEDIGGEALATLDVNKLRGTLNVVAVKAPGFGAVRKSMLIDLAILTGGKIITSGESISAEKVISEEDVIPENLSIQFERITLDDVGRAGKVIVTKGNTTIVDGAGKVADIQSRVKMLRAQIEKASLDYMREILQERLAKLASGVAVIHVGVAPETALKGKKAQVEDAINAARAALKGGIVPSSGVTLVQAARVLDQLRTDDADEGLGISIVKRALEEPLRTVAQNSGVESKVLIARIKAQVGRYGGGGDHNPLVASKHFEALIRAGAVEPATSVSAALNSAASIAVSMLMDVIRSRQAIDHSRSESSRP